MESTARLEVKVGLLLIAGLVAFVILILVSDRVDFEQRYAVSAYLPDAEGLLVGSPVTLSGIRVGRVAAIEPDLSGRAAIKVRMDILRSFDISSTSPLSLSTSGILGDAHLAFAGPGREPGPPLPKDGSAEVDAHPGTLARLVQQAEGVMAAAENLLEEESVNNIRRILAAGAETMEQGALLVSGLNQRQERLDTILDAMDRLLEGGNEAITGLHASAEESLQQVSAVLTQVNEGLGALRPQVEETLGESRQALARLGKILETVDQALADPDSGLDTLLADSGRSLSSLADILHDLAEGRGVLGQLLRSEDLAADLNAIAIDLSNAATAIADKPSVLVWGQRRRERAESQQQRLELRQRRAFMEGLPGVESGTAEGQEP
ncbi:MAG: MCE family protein [Planctomycetota bacterium]|nr:MAG: MCE family protein [Planctomycetota bacterium]